MITGIKTLLTAAAIAALVLAATSAGAVNFTEKEKAKLAAGKTVKKPLAKSGEKGFYGGTGYALIDAPVDVIWAAIEDWGKYHKIYPKTVSCKELSRKGDTSLIRIEMGHKLLSIEYHLTVERKRAKNMVSFKLVRNRPHDIEETRGYWRLFPQKDGRTLVAYVVATQVPMGIINLIGEEWEAKIQRHLLGIPGNLKKWVEGPGGNRYRTLTAKK
jgi:ribosome-associated toxin RatA of RatAB toxin-antitoxin module